LYTYYYTRLVQRMREFGMSNPMNHLNDIVAKIYFFLLYVNKENGKTKGIRCYESARIFYNVLKAFGHDVIVVNGGYIQSKNNRMRHSWVEKIVDCYGTTLLIETVPHLFYDLEFAELLKKMIIPPNDTRREKYEAINNEDFLEVLRHYGENIDSQLIEKLSLSILHYLQNEKENSTE